MSSQAAAKPLLDALDDWSLAHVAFQGTHEFESRILRQLTREDAPLREVRGRSGFGFWPVLGPVPRPAWLLNPDAVCGL
jgi:hypothetical protein